MQVECCNVDNRSSFRPSEADWVAIFQMVNEIRGPNDGGCILMARTLARLYKNRGVSADRMFIAAVWYADGRIEHAWLVVDEQSVHAPFYKLSDGELAEMERRAKIDKIMTLQLRQELKS